MKYRKLDNWQFSWNSRCPGSRRLKFRLLLLKPCYEYGSHLYIGNNLVVIIVCQRDHQRWIWKATYPSYKNINHYIYPRRKCQLVSNFIKLSSGQALKIFRLCKFVIRSINNCKTLDFLVSWVIFIFAGYLNKAWHPHLWHLILEILKLQPFLNVLSF